MVAMVIVAILFTHTQVGERVIVNSNVGTVRFTGVTKFAPG